MSAVVRLAMWSGPRNISTAMMRAWENRPDTVVVDEPLYAHYLAATGLDHPGREEILAAQSHDWREVVDQLLGPLPDEVAVFYHKHMAQHLLPDMDRAWIDELTNVLLIRDPREVVASYTKSRADVVPTDVGLLQQEELFDRFCNRGQHPLVIDQSDFLVDPRRYLEALCELVGVPFSDRMLSWSAGPRSSDGVWAKHWYHAVEASTGFGSYTRRDTSDLDEAYAEVASACEPAYERLHAARWRP